MTSNDNIMQIWFQTGKIPIHYACENGKIKVLECLINHGAQIDMQDKVSDD